MNNEIRKRDFFLLITGHFNAARGIFQISSSCRFSNKCVPYPNMALSISMSYFIVTGVFEIVVRVSIHSLKCDLNNLDEAKDSSYNEGKSDAS